MLFMTFLVAVIFILFLILRSARRQYPGTTDRARAEFEEPQIAFIHAVLNAEDVVKTNDPPGW